MSGAPCPISALVRLGAVEKVYAKVGIKVRCSGNESLSTSRRVLFMTPYLERGGTERHLIDLIRTLEWKEPPWVLGPEGPACSELDAAGARWVAVPQLRFNRATVSTWRTAFQAAVDAFQPHLVHAHAGLEQLWITRHLTPTVPRIFTVHGYTGAWMSYRLTSLLGPRLARRVIVVSRSEATRLGALSPRCLAVIPNGVADPRLLPPTRRPHHFPVGAVVVATASRLEPAKGVDLLVEAFRQIVHKSLPARLEDGTDAEATLVVMGSGSLEAELRERVRREGMERRIRFLGYLEDAGLFFCHADLAVQVSRHDALPLTVAEAMAAGVPTIVSDVGGLPELVEDGVTGKVIPSGRIEPLVEALEELLSDPERRVRMGHNARLRYESKFTLKQFAANTLGVYRDVLAETSPEPARPG